MPDWPAALAASPFAGWAIRPLAGDASTRAYARLTAPDGRTAILMDSGPIDPAPFLRISLHLRQAGLAAPDLLWQSEQDRSLLILEDLGPSHLARWLTDRPKDEADLYTAAVDAIHKVQTTSPPDGLGALTPDVGAAMLDPFFDWFAPALPRDLPRIAMADALERLAPGPLVLSLRDFHAENLIWRPDRQGTDQVGLLDFQDAFLAPPEYDLASLLRDARRDVSPEAQAAATNRFAALTGRDPAAATAVLAVQRNLRILGIFTRLARRDGKAHYLALLPRVTAHLRRDLAHPALAGLARAILPALSATAAPA